MINGEIKDKNTKIKAFRIPSILHLSICYTILNMLFIPQFAKGQESIAFSGVDTLVEYAMELVYQEQYDEAITICEDVIKKHPNNPLGYLGRAGIYHIVMLNYRISYFDSEFDSVTTLAIKIGNDAIKKNNQDANAFFALGASYGFRGLNRIRKGKWFGAFRDGLRGISNIKKAHKLDKELYDAYYALGLFYYWKSAKAKVLTFLMMMKDEREKEIEYLRIVSEKGLFSKYEAKFALVEIFYYEYRYEQALKECETLREKFPHDPTWNYLMAKTLDKLNRWDEAILYFRFLLNFLNTAPFKSNSFISECHYGVAKCAYESEDYEMAKKELKLALDYSKLWDKKKEIEGPLLDFDKVLKRMKKLDKELKKISN